MRFIGILSVCFIALGCCNHRKLLVAGDNLAGALNQRSAMVVGAVDFMANHNMALPEEKQAARLQYRKDQLLAEDWKRAKQESR